MNEFISSGPRKIPEAEKKFGLGLSAELFFSPDDPVKVVIVVKEKLDDDELLEVVSDSINGVPDVVLIGGAILSATVYPPDVRSKLTTIAGNDQVDQIIIDEPLMPPAISKSHFR